MSDALVLFDSVGWRTPDGDTVYAERGQVIDLPAEEFARLVDAGAVEPVEPAKPVRGRGRQAGPPGAEQPGPVEER